MYASVIAVQLSLVTIPWAHTAVAVPQAKNFLLIKRSMCLSINALEVDLEDGVTPLLNT